MRVSDRVREIEKAARQYAFVRYVVKVDETHYSIKYRLHIEADLFVQLYFNERSGTVGLALIHQGQRLYGRDCEAGYWHRHPMRDPVLHDSTTEGIQAVSVDEFLMEVQDILVRANLI
ncbi:MAG: hypothetical protein JW850_12005 [Thermoflexales bacterium]|nr:hypothetical protein [Thermoflexales bacterium]